jgi:hypothetical protein
MDIVYIRANESAGTYVAVTSNATEDYGIAQFINDTYYNRTGMAGKGGHMPNSTIKFVFYNSTSLAIMGANGTQFEPYIDVVYRTLDLDLIKFCTTPDANEAVAVNWTFRDEANDTQLSIDSFQSSFQLRMSNGTLKNASIDRSGTLSTVALCISPKDIHYLTNSTSLISKDGFNFRHHYFVNQNLTNNTLYLVQYMLEGGLATGTTFQFLDSLDNAKTNLITDVQKLFVVNNSWVSVAMLKSGEDGKDFAYLQHNIPTYRFVVRENNKTIKTTIGQKITAASLIIRIAPTALVDLINNLADIETNMTFSNHTLNFTFGWYDPNSVITAACLKVVHSNSSGRFLTVNTCTNGSYRGNIRAFAHNGTSPDSYSASGYVIIESSPARIHILETTGLNRGLSSNAAIWGTFGALLAIFILITLALTQSHNPVTMVAMVVMVLFAFMFVQIISLPTRIAMGVMAGLIIIIIKLRT